MPCLAVIVEQQELPSVPEGIYNVFALGLEPVRAAPGSQTVIRTVAAPERDQQPSDER